MQVLNIQLETGTNSCRLSADVHFDTHWVWGDEPFHLWYEFPGEYAEFVSAENGDPFVAALLSSAMFLGEPLIISDAAAVSHRLHAAIPRIQDIYHCWNPNHSRIDVETEIRPPTTRAETSERSALFYSLGVDSSYSLSKCLARPSHVKLPHLVMVQGFDVYLWEGQRFPPMYRAAKDLANQLGTQVLPVTTNLREFSDRVTDWVHYFHGPALASVVLALGCCFRKVTIAAAQTYRHLTPRGAHPLLDPHWGTEWTDFEHDGLEADRLGKLRALSRVPSLIRNLRVCTTSELTDSYNCGRCEKCLRTMIYLHIAGALELCETLPHTIELETIRSLRLVDEVAVGQLELLLSQLGSSDFEAEIAAALRERIAAFHAQKGRE